MKVLFTRKAKMWTIALATFFASVTTNAATSVDRILGDYKGVLSIYLSETPITSVDTIAIGSSLQENSVKFSLKDFTLDMGGIVIPVGDIVLDSVAVKSLSGADSLVTKTINMSVNALGAVLPATVTLSGAVVQDSVFVNLVVATSMSGASITVPVYFKGEKIKSTVANEVLNVVPDFWVVGGNLFINAEEAGVLRVYSITGQLVRQRALGVGQTTIALPKGIYVVSLNKKVQKVLVK